VADATGLSRHTVRAALARLADERLVVAEPYRGVRITTFDDDDVIALQQLRGALESEAVRLLRERHGRSWPAEVTRPVVGAIGAMARLRGKPARDWPTVAAAHADIHTALVTSAGSPRVTDAYAGLHSEMLLLLVHLEPFHTVAGLVTEHRDYLAAVQRDGEPAVRAHLDSSTAMILAARHR
jgi:DNA-binding GntR family transcriptional regulator